VTKVVYNACFGGFSLSHAGIMRYAELKGLKLYPFVDVRDKDGRLRFGKQKPATADDLKEARIVHYCTTPEYSNESYWTGRDMERADPALVQVVEELGEKANGSCAKLAIEDVPAGALYRIDEYDGNESVMTQGGYEWKTA
jgi:hypothetical protein